LIFLLILSVRGFVFALPDAFFAALFSSFFRGFHLGWHRFLFFFKTFILYTLFFPFSPVPSALLCRPAFFSGESCIDVNDLLFGLRPRYIAPLR